MACKIQNIYYLPSTEKRWLSPIHMCVLVRLIDNISGLHKKKGSFSPFENLGKPSRVSGVLSNQWRPKVLLCGLSVSLSAPRPSYDPRWRSALLHPLPAGVRGVRRMCYTGAFILSMWPQSSTPPIRKNLFHMDTPACKKARKFRLCLGYYVLAKSLVTMETWRLAAGEQLEASTRSPFVLKKPTGSLPYAGWWSPVGRRECSQRGVRKWALCPRTRGSRQSFMS